MKRRKRPPPPRSPGNSSCAPTLYQRGMERRPREDYPVAMQQCSTPPSHEGRGKRIDEERKEESTRRAAILIGDRFRRGGKRGRRFHLPVRARLSHPHTRQSHPNPPAAHRDQPSSRETNLSGVSLRPGGGARPFWLCETGLRLGPTAQTTYIAARGWATLVNTPQASGSLPSQFRNHCRQS